MVPESLASESLLPLQPRDFICGTQRENVLAVFRKPILKQAGHVGRTYRAEGLSAPARLYFHQRFQPERTARSIAHQSQRNRPPRSFSHYGLCHCVCLQGQREHLTEGDAGVERSIRRLLPYL